MPADTIVWITGATSGIGDALARSVPFPDARVVNVSRRPHPDFDSVVADLADPAGWDAVDAHLRQTLGGFTGRRAIFVNNAFAQDPVGFVGEVDPDLYRRHVLTNVAAPLVLAEAFLRHVPPTVEAGLVMISSAAARVPYPARAAYGAGKASMEQWVRAVREEITQRGADAWAVAVRPGAVDTPSLRADAAADPDANPLALTLRAAFDAGTVDSPALAARRIWEVLPPTADTPAVVLLGTMITQSGPDTSRRSTS
jgi:NAD(P)-dependent dehydrogenase (short-subunit alcohol dehydrogenase family)